MQLKICLNHENCADGNYSLKAKGCIAVSLHWADKNGMLAEWTAFAYIPITPQGKGKFCFRGERAIPKEATHVLARGIHSDFSMVEECLEPLPNFFRKSEHSEQILKETQEELQEELQEESKEAQQLLEEKEFKFAVISDLHITEKTGRLAHALKYMHHIDGLLLPGDLVNDGSQEQFQRLKECLEAWDSSVPIVTASGNHDYPIFPIPRIQEEVCDYPIFQTWIAERNRKLGYQMEMAQNGVSVLSLGEIEIIALNAATHRRRFVFRQGEQISWLKEYLKTSEKRIHILICHTPLFAHNPQGKKGEGNPYLSRDKELQEIIDSHKGVIYISGHTHLSPNQEDGCVEYDRQHGNLYINDGSLCPAELKNAGLLAPTEWADGNVVWLTIRGTQVSISYTLLHSRKKIARGFYQWVL